MPNHASPTLTTHLSKTGSVHPTWLEPDEWLGRPDTRRHPLLLIANQPNSRLHSQHDVGALSLAAKPGPGSTP